MMHFKPELPDFQKKAKVAIEGAMENPKQYLSPFESSKEGYLFSLIPPATLIAAPFLIIAAITTAALAMIGLAATITAFCIQTAYSCLKPKELEMHAYFKLKTIYAGLFTAATLLSTIILPIAAVILPFTALGLLCIRSINSLKQYIENKGEKFVDTVFNEMNEVDILSQDDHSFSS